MFHTDVTRWNAVCSLYLFPRFTSIKFFHLVSPVNCGKFLEPLLLMMIVATAAGVFIRGKQQLSTRCIFSSEEIARKYVGPTRLDIFFNCFFPRILAILPPRICRGVIHQCQEAANDGWRFHFAIPLPVSEI